MTEIGRTRKEGDLGHVIVFFISSSSCLSAVRFIATRWPDAEGLSRNTMEGILQYNKEGIQINNFPR